MKMKIKDITLKNIGFVIQAWYQKFIIKQYQRIDGDSILDSALNKVAACPDCYKNGECLHSDCGCNMDDVIFSDKPCPKGKF